MKSLSHSDVAILVQSLPEKKLQEAYHFLSELAGSSELADSKVDTRSPQLDFIRLPLNERRRLLAEQADQLKAHYEQTKGEREEWQGGDFIEDNHSG
jgi:hypothetical protein